MSALQDTLGQLAGRDHAPAQSRGHGGIEPADGGDLVERGPGVARSLAARAHPACAGTGPSAGLAGAPRGQPAALQTVPGAELLHGNGPEIHGTVLAAVPVQQGGRRHRVVVHGTQFHGEAARDRRRVLGDGRDDRAGAQQLMRVLLVLEVQLQDRIVPGGGLPQYLHEPGRHRVGVDRHGQHRAPAGALAEGSPRLVLQHGHLPGEAQHPVPGGRGAHRNGARQQDLAGVLLERFDALGESGAGDPQGCGGSVEGPLVHGGGQSS